MLQRIDGCFYRRQVHGGDILFKDSSPCLHWLYDAALIRAAEELHADTSRSNHNAQLSLFIVNNIDSESALVLYLKGASF